MAVGKSLVMVDFWSYAGPDGKPVGHGCKVGNEYYEYVKDDFDVRHYINESMMPYIDDSEKVSFDASITHGLGKKDRVMRCFKCLRQVYRDNPDGTIWFYVPDIYLFIFILFAAKGKRRLAVNVFEEYKTNKIKNRIFRKALKKIDYIFVTNPYLQKDIPSGVLIPDYAYDEERYKNYRCEARKRRAVCLGTMNEKKQIREAVETFSIMGYPLYVAGQFTSAETYDSVLKIKEDNVTVENRFVENDEYYRLLSESEYCIIPYDAGFYRNRTSGVIQECLFCDCIPIAPRSILEFCGVEGVGYEDIHELNELSLDDVDAPGIRAGYKRLRDDFYDKAVVKRKVVEGIKDAV